MLSSKPSLERKYKLILIFCKQNSIFISQNLYLPHFYEVRKEFIVIFTKDSGHELVYIEEQHVLIVVAVKIAYIPSDLLDLPPLFHQININNPIVRIEDILVFLFEQSPFDTLFVNNAFKLFFLG